MLSATEKIGFASFRPCVFFILAVAVAACAQDMEGDSNSQPMQKLSLQAAIRQALENNHQLKASSHSVSAQREDIGIARSYMLPRIAFDESLTRTDTPGYAFSYKMNQGRLTTADMAGAPATFNDPGYINDYQTSFSVEQPIFAPQAMAGIDMSQKRFDAAAEGFGRTREQIAFSVAQSYFAVHTAGELVDAALKGVDDANEHLRISKVRYDSGLGLHSDTLRASTSLKESQQKLITAGKDLNLAQRTMGLLLGTQQSVNIEDNALEINVKQIQYYIAAAVSRGDIKSAKHSIEAAKKNVDFASAEYLPVLGVKGSYQLDDHSSMLGSEGDSWMGVLFMRWYLFDGFRRDHQQAKAKFQVAQAKESLLELEDAISYRIYQAYLTIDEMHKNVLLAKSSLETANEGVRLVRERYENSLSPLVDLLDAQLMLDHARTNLAIKENQYRIAGISLYFESGTILKELGIE